MMSRVLGRSWVFAARLRRHRWARFNITYYSTKTAPNVPGMEYQDAVCTLNMLQSTAQALRQMRQKRSHLLLQLQSMREFLNRAGHTVEELDHLNIIHVTGTKGKGSTCAFTEQILRTYGFRTGFYSSPHLVQVRERIRIDGQPIAKELFAKYFWEVYGRLHETKDANQGAMPAYFQFLTLMAFHVFLQEKVDLAVIEVGVGGEYDCTNIIRAPWVCGISSLGIDHTHVLGDTIDLIAWQKGGIFKPGVPAFTVRQPENAIAVLKDRAKEIKCTLRVCPELGDYPTDCGPLRLGLAGQHQHSNASLALQLSHTWLQRRCLPDNKFPSDHLESSGTLQAVAFEPSPNMLSGLADTEWPGRNQIVKHGAVTYFLDGAHTMRSMQACVDWFREAAAQHETSASGPVCRVLLFNTSGERDSAAMLKLLLPCQFDVAVFCPNITSANGPDVDQQNFNVSVEKMLTSCLDNEKSWHLHNSSGPGEDERPLIEAGLPMVTRQKVDTAIFSCIHNALQWIAQGRDTVLTDQATKASVAAEAGALRQAAEIHVLICGSLHLVGGALRYLAPDYSK